GLPALRWRPAHRNRHQRNAVAHAGIPDRDGLRGDRRWRAGYASRRRDPGAARSRPGRAPAVLPPGPLRPPTPGGPPSPARAERLGGQFESQRSTRQPTFNSTANVQRRSPAPRRETPAMVPTDLRYTKDHEWVRVDGDE